MLVENLCGKKQFKSVTLNLNGPKEGEPLPEKVNYLPLTRECEERMSLKCTIEQMRLSKVVRGESIKVSGRIIKCAWKIFFCRLYFTQRMSISLIMECSACKGQNQLQW